MSKPAEPLDGRRNEGAAGLLVAQVARHKLDPASGLPHPGRCLLGIGLLGCEIADRHIGTLAREGDGHRAPDPGIAAGDQGDAPLQQSLADVALLAMVRRRRHLGREAWLGLLLLAQERRLRLAGAGIVGHADAPFRCCHS